MNYKLNDFKGELEKIDPSLLISKDRKRDIFEDFFLTLGVIYNDIKGIILFDKLIFDLYRKPELGEDASPHVGEYYGVLGQSIKMMAGVIGEFFRFLEENSKVLESEQFKILLKKLNKKTREDWEALEGIALGYRKNKASFANFLKNVRNNVAFHYYQSGVPLRRGFARCFFEEEKNKYNEYAFYSSGNTMEGVRFYYADAASDWYIKSLMDDSSNCIEEFKEAIKLANRVISALLMVYLRQRSSSSE